jgi:hypothetical protein
MIPRAATKHVFPKMQRPAMREQLFLRTPTFPCLLIATPNPRLRKIPKEQSLVQQRFAPIPTLRLPKKNRHKTPMRP